MEVQDTATRPRIVPTTKNYLVQNLSDSNKHLWNVIPLLLCFPQLKSPSPQDRIQETTFFSNYVCKLEAWDLLCHGGSPFWWQRQQQQTHPQEATLWGCRGAVRAVAAPSSGQAAVLLGAAPRSCSCWAWRLVWTRMTLGTVPSVAQLHSSGNHGGCWGGTVPNFCLLTPALQLCC